LVIGSEAVLLDVSGDLGANVNFSELSLSGASGRKGANNNQRGVFHLHKFYQSALSNQTCGNEQIPHQYPMAVGFVTATI
jgi:hypothetical protein